MDHFYKSCFEAGDECSLKRSSDLEWEDLKQRVDGLIGQTNEEPISLLWNNKITVITGTELRSAFTLPIYSPLASFKRLSDVLSGAIDGNYTLLLSDLASRMPRLHDGCTLPNSSTIAAYETVDPGHAIKCGDADDDTHHGLPYFRSYLQELKSQSSTLGAYWATIRFSCSGWTIRPKWRFTGPFTTPEPDSSLVKGKPAAPLLFLSSRLDPVTPLRNAVTMAARHPGASWVVQESTGHCALAAPSKCTKKIIQDYLENGVVPESGTSCQADCDEWHPCEEKDAAMSINMAIEHEGAFRRGRLGI